MRERKSFKQPKKSYRDRTKEKIQISKKPVSRKQYERTVFELRKETSKKKIAIALIPLIALSVFVGSVMGLRTILVNFHTSDDFSPLNFDKIVLITSQNDEIIEYEINKQPFEIPKNTEFKAIKVYQNKTSSLSQFNASYFVEHNIQFQQNQSHTNIEYVEGTNFLNITNEWKTGINLHKELLVYFSFNRSYQEIKNMSIDFRFLTNETSLSHFSVSYFDFLKNDWSSPFYDKDDLILGELNVSGDEIKFPSLFLNRSSPQQTTMGVRFYARQQLTGGKTDYLFYIEYVNISGFFWKEIDSFLSTYTLNFTINNSITIDNDYRIYEHKTIISNIINITQIYEFGSFKETIHLIYNNTVILETLIYTFPIKEFDLNLASGYGLYIVDIEIKDINLEKNKIERTINFSKIRTF